jgi:hypothetical protein
MHVACMVVALQHCAVRTCSPTINVQYHGESMPIILFCCPAVGGVKMPFLLATPYTSAVNENDELLRWGSRCAEVTLAPYSSPVPIAVRSSGLVSSIAFVAGSQMKVDMFKRAGLNLAPRTFLMSSGATIIARFRPTAASDDSSTHNIVAIHDLSDTSSTSPAPWRRFALLRVGDAILCVSRPPYLTHQDYGMEFTDGSLRTTLQPFTVTKTVACVLDLQYDSALCLENVTQV